MDLLVDIGNTRIKWATLAAGGLRDTGAIEHGADPAACAALFDRIATVPTRVSAANVAGDRFGAQFAAAVRERWNLSVRYAATQPNTAAVCNGYDDFSQLGVDRWLAIIAAVDRFAGSVCVVDAGTAVTIDVVASGGAHLGGFIIPGLDLMHRSLAGQTGDLGRLAADEPSLLSPGLPAPGRGTAAAIGGGAVAAACCLIDRSVDLLDEPGKNATLVVTGGDARRLIRHLDRPAQHRPLLVLEGLAVYEFDQPAEF